MAAKNARRYFPGLEGIRGIAAMLVLVNHVGVYTGVIGSSLFGAPGDGVLGAVINRFEVALPIFFVVSGALLFRPYALATLQGDRRPAAGPYYWRRALRILPAYWILTVLALLLLNANALTGVWPVLRPLLFLQVYQKDAIPAGMGQTWSLPTEVAFYILLPPFAALVARFVRRAASVTARARRMLVPLIALIVVGLAFTAYTHLPSMGAYPVPYLWLPEYIGFLAVGMMLAVLSARAELTPKAAGLYGGLVRRPVACWGVAIAALALACTPIAGPSTVDYPGMSDALVVEVLYLIFSGCLVAPLTVPAGRSRTVDATVANPVILYLGRISYGIFLWHVFFLDGYYQWTHATQGKGGFWTLLAISLSGSLIVATISYYAVERPAMRLRPRLGKAPATPSTPTPTAVPSPASAADTTPAI